MVLHAAGVVCSVFLHGTPTENESLIRCCSRVGSAFCDRDAVSHEFETFHGDVVGGSIE